MTTRMLALFAIAALLPASCAPATTVEPGPAPAPATEPAPAPATGPAAEAYVPPAGVRPQDLWVIVYASEPDRPRVDAARDAIQDRLGDAGPLLHVDLASHYRGLAAEGWIVLSAYDSAGFAGSDLALAESRGLEATMRNVLKLCDDDIGVCGT